MEYIYCKNREDFEYILKTLKRSGYTTKLLLGWALNREKIEKEGITIFVSDIDMIVTGSYNYGFNPKGCKPSRRIRGTGISGVYYKINEPCVSEVWKDLNKFMATKPNTELKTDLATKPNTELKTNLEPLDDTEELETDREKLRKFAKDTNGKAKITLAPMQILKDIAEVREYGVKKYGSVDSWKEVPIEDYRDALFRHLLEYIKDPSGVDKESGIKHYKHIACNLAFICEMENMEDGTRSI